MFTRNYDNVVAAFNLIAADDYMSQTSTYGEGYLTVKNKDGTISRIYKHTGNTSYPTWSPFYKIVGHIAPALSNYGYTAISLGANDTAESYEDYQFSPITSVTPQTPVYASPVYDSTNKKWISSCTVPFLATSDTVVKEIYAFYVCLRGSGVYANPLIWRKVLDSPITVPANSVLAVTLTIECGANPNEPQVSASVE